MKKKKEGLPTESLFSIENELNLANICCIEKNGQRHWCIANVVGQGDKTIYQFKFLWEFLPYHENAIDSESMAGLLDLLGYFNKGEQLEFFCSSFKDPRGSYCPPLENLSPELKLFQKNRAHRLKILTQQGLRRRVRYHLAKGFTIHPAEIEVSDKYERVLATVFKFWDRHITGEEASSHQDKVMDLLRMAYQRLYEYEGEICSRARIQATLQDGHQIWRFLWERFNGWENDPIPLPYYLYCNLDTGELAEKDLQGNFIEPDTRLELVSYLITQDSQPKPHAEYIYLPGRKQYCAVLGFEGLPDRYKSPEDKYTWLWTKVFADSGKTTPSDFEVITQFTWADPDAAMRQVKNVTKQQRLDAADRKRKGEEGVEFDLAATEGTEAQKLLISGDFPQYVAPAILVYAPSLDELDASVRFFKTLFTVPSKLYQEKDFGWKAWLQTSLIRNDPLFFDVPNSMFPAPSSDYRHKINVSGAMGLVQTVGVPSPAKSGVPFISVNGRSEFLLSLQDSAGSPIHGATFGRTGSGKSAMKTGTLLTELGLGHACTLVDLPDSDGHSTYGSLVRYLNGATFDPAKTSSNILQRINTRSLDPQVAKERNNIFLQNVIQALQALVLDTARSLEGIPVSEVASVLTIATQRFYQDQQVLNAIESAERSGIGTANWADYPTLHHFLNFLSLENLDLDAENPRVIAAIDFIKLQLRYWLDNPVLSNAIATPSTEDFDSNLLANFSLRNISNDEEALVYGLLVHTSAIRRSMAHDRSYYYVDECSVFLKYAAMARNIGHGCATLRKSGVSIDLAMQDPNAIKNCADPDRILQNLTYFLIGRVSRNALTAYQEILKVPPHLLAANIPDTRDRATQSTRWLIVEENMTQARYYSPEIELGAILNNKEESACRQIFMEQASNKYVGLAQFAQWATSEMKCGRTLDPSTLTTKELTHV